LFKTSLLFVIKLYQLSPAINTLSVYNSNSFIVKEIFNRVKTLKKITNAKIVFIRVPPVYVDKRSVELVERVMAERIKGLKKAGIFVIGETIVSSDKNLFCDSYHPNKKGRDFFSMYLKISLNDLKLLH